MKTIESYGFSFASGAPKQQSQELASLERVEYVVPLDPSRVGKSHAAMALDCRAVTVGINTRFITAADLMIQFVGAKAQGGLKATSIGRFLGRRCYRRELSHLSFGCDEVHLVL